LISRPDEDRPSLLIPSSILASYVSVAQSCGLDPYTLARKAGLDPACLFDPGLPVSALRVTRLIEGSAIEAGLSDFGIRLALGRGTPDIGPLNLLLREEPDLRSALKSMQSFMHVHSRSIQVSLDEREDHPVLGVSHAINVGASQATEMILCSMMLTTRWLVGADWAPVAVCFTHRAPPDAAPQRAVFGCPAEFSQPLNGLILERADLDRSIAHSGAMLRRHAETYVRSLARDMHGDFPEAVSGLIAALLPSGRCSSARVARHLGMDRATLQRRLALSGRSYSELLQDMRLSLVEKAHEWDWPLADLADQLGFSSPSVFSRWFRQNYGRAPSVWRKERLRPMTG